MLAIQLSRTGGPEVLEAVEVPDPAPGPGQVLIRHAAIGLNFIETYQRSGLYPLKLPSRIGSEAAGTIEALGPGADRFKIGDRVAYASSPPGAYAELNCLAQDRVVALPGALSFEDAAAALLKGMTAEMLLKRCAPVGPGDAILIQAAAGGVGLILSQWAKALGCTVIGTAGSPDKAALAKAHGCDHVILYDHDDVAAKVRALTDGKGVAVAYDSVGARTLHGSMASLAKRGTLVSFGNASGPPPAIDPLDLMRGGSLFLTRPTLGDYTASPQDLQASADALFAVLASGAVKILIGQTFPLKDAALAHRAMEGRQTTGSSLLIP